MLRHLVTEDVLVEEVKKSDLYGSVSSVLKASVVDNSALLILTYFMFHHCVERGISLLLLLTGIDLSN